MNRSRILGIALLLAAITVGGAYAQSQPATPAAPATPAPETKAPAKKAAAKPQMHWTADQIKQAQDALTKGGYYKGKATGKWDRATARALRAWQKANKMPATGRLTQEILTKLQSS